FMVRLALRSTLFPYTTLFRSRDVDVDIIFLMVIRRYTQTLGARTDHGKCSLNRLLHHVAEGTGFNHPAFAAHGRCFEGQKFAPQDRKSTRLNSSHVKISYAVF